MRDVTDKNCKAYVADGQEIHTIYFRRPMNTERAKFQASVFKREGRKVISRLNEARLKFGALVITGFEKGTIGANGKVFASDPEDPDFREDWKKLLIENAADIVEAVGKQAFEGTTSAMAENVNVDTEEDPMPKLSELTGSAAQVEVDQAGPDPTLKDSTS